MITIYGKYANAVVHTVKSEEHAIEAPGPSCR